MPEHQDLQHEIARLKSIRLLLDQLHRTLLSSEREAYEAVFGKISTPSAFLTLILQDPWFTWLRSLSGLMASIDETLDGKKPPTEITVNQSLQETQSLLVPSGEPGEGFAKEYLEALQRDPDVVMTHAEIMKTLKR